MINGDCNPQTGRVIATAAGIFLINDCGAVLISFSPPLFSNTFL